MNHDVLIISAFGRGNWLAVACARAGMKTGIVDVSESLGLFVPEDNEGPFGFFNSERIVESQMERMIEDDPLESVPQGFTLWLPDGPLEFKGSIVKYLLNRRNVPEEVVDYIYGAALHAGEFNQPKRLVHKAFKEAWLAHLAHSLSSTTWQRNRDACRVGEASPLFSNLFVRSTSRQGLNRSLEWCMRNQVDVFDRSQILDISAGFSGSLQGIEMQSGGELKSDLRKAEQFIFCLVSEELRFLSPRLSQKLFPGGELIADWYWGRFRLRISECAERDQLPQHFLMIQDLEFPWVHENFVVAQRTAAPDQIDFWLRLPSGQRFHQKYLHEHGDRLLDVLGRRISECQIEIINYPLSEQSTYEELGPPRHPVFTCEQRKSWGGKKFSNVRWNSSEHWTHHGWTGQFDFQQNLFRELSQWWQAKLAQQKRKE